MNENVEKKDAVFVHALAHNIRKNDNSFENEWLERFRRSFDCDKE